jgi:flagellar hook-associated protein 2
MTSKETGIVNKITTTVTDIGDSNNSDNLGLSRLAYTPDAMPLAITNLQEITVAADAQITIDGAIVVTNSNNVFEDVIDGVDITAKKLHAVDDEISEISFSANNANIESGLAGFVSSYNDLQALSKQLGAAGESGSGPLAGDSLLRGVMSKLRQELSKTFDTGNGTSMSLTQLGVQSDRFGVLSLDTDILDESIANNVDAIEQFFIGNGTTDGFAGSINVLTSFYTDSDGIIQNRIDSGNNKLERLENDRLDFGRRMESLEARLFAQYNAMDLLVSQLNSTSSYIMAQLDNMPGVVRKDN